jgi:hypothetical protein
VYTGFLFEMARQRQAELIAEAQSQRRARAARARCQVSESWYVADAWLRDSIVPPVPRPEAREAS